MLRAKDSLTSTLRKTLIIQVALTGVVAIVALIIKTPEFALSVVYGGLVTIVGTALHAWRMLKIVPPTDDSDALLSHGNAATEVFRGILLKYSAMIGLLGLGMGILKLDALAILVGFTIAYVGFVFSGGYAPRSKPQK